jgi:hypothetical protein
VCLAPCRDGRVAAWMGLPADPTCVTSHRKVLACSLLRHCF